MYLHFHRARSRPTVADFLAEHVRNCPALARDGGGPCRSSRQGGITYWDAGRAAGGDVAVVADNCQDVVDYWTRPSRLLMVTERFSDSIWLLATLVGVAAPRTPRKNARDVSLYAQNVSLAAEAEVAAALAARRV